MPFHPIPDIVQVTSTFTFPGDESNCVWYLDHPHPATELTSAEADQISDMFLAFFTQPQGLAPNAINDLMPQEVNYRGVLVRDMVDETRPQYEIPQLIPGDNAGDMSAPQLACCMTVRTARVGRSFRGRKFFGPFVREMQFGASAEVNPALKTALTEAGDFLIEQSALIGMEWMIVSQFSGTQIVNGKKVPIRRAVPISTLVTSVFVGSAWDTIKSRRSGFVG